MATASTSKISRQSHLFVALLILLWGLVLCFVGYQYNRERSHIRGILSAQLQLLNLQLGDIVVSGADPELFFERNEGRFDDLDIVIFHSRDSVTCYNCDKTVVPEHLSVIDEFKLTGAQVVVRPSLEDRSVSILHSVTSVEDFLICSSCSYSLSLFDVFRRGGGFLLIAVVISLLISLIGYMTSQLYRNLNTAILQRNKEQEAVRREEQDKQRLKRQLTNNINHELKTPICSILGYMDMLLNNPKLEEDQSRRFIQKSYEQAERLRCLMTDLSTITRIDEASDIIERETIDLWLLIQDVCDDVVPQLQKQNMVITTNITKKLLIEGNHSLLYSIFRNLVDNAIAYSGGRNIWIDLVKEDDTKYYFSLRDNGIGVAPKHLPYIFERFYRVDKGRSRKLGGTGLGLSIVKNAVLFHSGTIEARLEEMGGLEFRFSLGGKC